MQHHFYLLDDDRSIRKILQNIIESNDEGVVVGQSDNGETAIREINMLRPHIVLVDLLLPDMDGIAVVETLKTLHPQTGFVMLSQVTHKNMVAKAYTGGVDFFINKPINVIEVLAVITQVKARIEMADIIQTFRRTLDTIPVMNKNAPVAAVKDVKVEIAEILSKLGIAGEYGSNEITEIILLLLEKKSGMLNEHVPMNHLYQELSARYKERHGIEISPPTLEQRVRRATNKALNNVASMGIEDYGSDWFLSTSSLFFEFNEVRKQMNYIREQSDYGGRVNTKKFLEGILHTLKKGKNEGI